MKKILYLIISIIPLFVIAQKQGNIWYFGIQSGLDFSSGMPVVLTNGQTGTDFLSGTNNQEGTSCISDSAGNLLFYTGGKTIWNRNHSPMPNGTGIMGGVSSTQSSLIVPLPGCDSIFYVFTSDEFQDYYGSSTPKGYRYSIVNMCMDNGNGDVIINEKNILLCDSSTEKIAACEDASETGYWIVGHKMFSDEFYSWHLTSGGITNTVVSKIGTIHGWNQPTSTWNISSAQGQMMLNASGTKLALAISNFDPAYLDLFDFNNNTGAVSNFCHIVIDSALGKRIHGVEFSPDGSMLYVTTTWMGKSQILQFDVTAGSGNCDSIKSSCFNLFQSTIIPMYFGMQLAPNNKIYVVVTCDQLGCINFPDSSFLAANFDSAAISPGNTDCYMLPSFIAGYKYQNSVSNCSTEDIAEANSNLTAFQQSSVSSAYPNPNNGSTQIDYTLPDGVNVGKIVFYDLPGNEVKRFTVDRTFNSLLVSTNDIAAGTYYYQLQTTADNSEGKKMVVIK